MFYVSGRLRAGTHSGNLCDRVGPLERTSRVRGEEFHLYLFYVSLRLWEVYLYVFYVSGRVRGGTGSGDL